VILKNKNKLVCVVINSRANYARIKSTLLEIKKTKNLDLKIILAASAVLDKVGDIRSIIKKDGFKHFIKLSTILDGNDPVIMSKSTGIALMELSSIFDNMKPSFVITVADRFETIATAIAASFMNITLIHTQGGEKTGSIDESVRHSITKLAHIHFPANLDAKKRIIKMGEDPKYVFNTGCPSLDLIKSVNFKHYSYFYKKYFINKKYISLDKKFLLVVQHPVTTEFEDTINQILETLMAVHYINLPAIWLWPNIDAGSQYISKQMKIYIDNNNIKNIKFVKNFSPEDYLKIMHLCSCIVGNSSSAIREGSFMGVPSINIGSRQNNRIKGINVIDTKYNKKNIINAIKKQLKVNRYKRSKIYGDGFAGLKMAKIISKINAPLQKIIKF
tara:strand:- start:2831 stop:3994 length:1164 start_codon:yes stop_codon:yes gene_type:complete